MATLQIKNKYEVTFKKLISESRGAGGVPDLLQVNGKEAWDILNEMRLVGMHGFEVEATDEYDPNFMLRSSKDKLDKETATDLVTRWWKKEFKVNFLDDHKRRIPIEVISKPTVKPAPPKNDKSSSSDEVKDKPTPPEQED